MDLADLDPDLAPRTRAVLAGRPAAQPGAPLSPPVVLSSTFRADGDLAYARDGNPTWSSFETAVGALEGGAALAFASGTAALYAVLETLPVGAVVAVPDVAYSGTVALLDQLETGGRLVIRRVPPGDLDAMVTAVEGASLAWVESEANPTLEVADIPALAAATRRQGVPLVVDATFVTPVVQRPLDLGADVVVHSATKYLSGHSDVLLGVTVTRDQAWTDRLAAIRHDRGAIAGPFETWLALRGLRTLDVRIDRASANADELAVRLRQHPCVARVRHPSLKDDPGHAVASRDWDRYGCMVSVEVRGDAAAAEAVAAGTRLWAHATSLGGVESSLERRRRWASEPRGVPETLLRLSVGIEDVDDLWADLERALDHLR